MGYATTSYGGVSFDIRSITISRRPKTIKHTIGKTVAILGEGIGINALERVIDISGNITSTIDATRTSLLNLEDGQRHAYVDGMNDGNYVIEPNSLVFDDEGGRSVVFYTFSMRLIEW